MIHRSYVALRRTLPTELPPELVEHRQGLSFARWLVLTGKLSDFEPEPRDVSMDIPDAASDLGQATALTA